jgi:ribosomal protein S18 acetylase RimI-like enzyme
MGVDIVSMTIQDYDEVTALWKESEGIQLSDADSRVRIAHFLERNPGLSLVAREGGKLVGAVLCGHDGRRAYIDHLAVHSNYRRQGIGRTLVGRCMYALMQMGIPKCHILITEGNEDAVSFWRKLGWAPRVEMLSMIRELPEGA